MQITSNSRAELVRPELVRPELVPPSAVLLHPRCPLCLGFQCFLGTRSKESDFESQTNLRSSVRGLAIWQRAPASCALLLRASWRIFPPIHPQGWGGLPRRALTQLPSTLKHFHVPQCRAGTWEGGGAGAVITVLQGREASRQWPVPAGGPSPGEVSEPGLWCDPW